MNIVTRTLPLLMVPVALVAAQQRATQPPPPQTPSPISLPAEKHLRNVKQLTNAGENAEAYFSFDGKRLSFQSTAGHGCDQIYTMNIDGTDRKLVSTGKGRTTC